LSGIPDAAPTSYAACHHDVEAPIDTGNKGVFYLNSHVRSDEIEDGLSHTLFVGDKRARGDELGWASGTRATLRNTGTPINRTILDPADLTPFQISLSPNPNFPDPNVPQMPADPALAANPDQKPATVAQPITVGGYGSQHSDGANFLLGDGAVRFLRTSINTRVYQLLANRNDGVALGDDQF